MGQMKIKIANKKSIIRILNHENYETKVTDYLIIFFLLNTKNYPLSQYSMHLTFTELNKNVLGFYALSSEIRIHRVFSCNRLKLNRNLTNVRLRNHQ